MFDEHRHWPSDDATHLEHLLQHVPAGILQSDQYDVGIKQGQAGEQICAFAHPRDVAMAGLQKTLFQDGGANRVLVDNGNLESRPHATMLKLVLQRSKEKYAF